MLYEFICNNSLNQLRNRVKSRIQNVCQQIITMSSSLKRKRDDCDSESVEGDNADNTSNVKIVSKANELSKWFIFECFIIAAKEEEMCVIAWKQMRFRLLLWEWFAQSVQLFLHFRLVYQRTMGGTTVRGNVLQWIQIDVCRKTCELWMTNLICILQIINCILSLKMIFSAYII